MDDVIAYAVSDDLEMTIADALAWERQNQARRQFLKKMADAVHAGIAPQGIAESARASGSVVLTHPGLPTAKGPAILNAVTAFVFSAWLATGEASANGIALAGNGTSHGSSLSVELIQGGAEFGHGISAALNTKYRSVGSTDVKQRVAALDWLANAGKRASPAAPTLRQRFKLPDPLSRFEAAWAIGYVSEGLGEDVAALVVALEDKNSRVQVTAALALGQIGPPAKSALSVP